MSRWVIDTNVPIVANGRADPENGNSPTIDCRLATVAFLLKVVRRGKILLDLEGQIQEEYRRHLNSRGQPGVGDRFYQVVLNSAPSLVERFNLSRLPDGEYSDMPTSLVAAGFDPSDRKFVALAHSQNAPVVNATDSDWIEHADLLAAEDIRVRNLCGCNVASWFAG